MLPTGNFRDQCTTFCQVFGDLDGTHQQQLSSHCHLPRSMLSHDTQVTASVLLLRWKLVDTKLSCKSFGHAELLCVQLSI